MYALRRPDGTWHVKSSGYNRYPRTYPTELTHHALFRTKQALRQSYGWGFRHSPALAAYVGWTGERPGPGLFDKYYRHVTSKLRELSTDDFFALLAQDGFELVEPSIVIK